MYTPWQWRVAFPVVTLVVAILAAALVYALRVGNPALAGTCAGIIAGLAFSVAFSMRRFVPRIALALVAFGCAGLGALFTRSVTEIAIAAGLAAAVFAAWFLFYEVLFTRRFHRETVSPLVHLGEGKGKRALIVYHSAHRGLQRALQRELADALAAQGWQADLTTASVAAPLDIAAYDLLVLGVPSYNWIPARPITSYVRRLRDLRGKNVVLIVSGGGMTARAMTDLRGQVEAAGGSVVEALELWTARPNVMRFGKTEPQQIMRGLGEDLARRLG